jgi:hypothetical protein
MIRIYYLGTLLFLLLDVILDVNIRIAFLETQPVLRASYYVFLFVCTGLMLWRPAWALAIGVMESMISLAALILSMGIRAMLVTDAVLEGGSGVVTAPEIINFMISGTIGYIAYLRAMEDFRRS